MPITDAENEKLGDMLSKLQADFDALNDWEKGFIKDQIDRHAKYGANIHMSPKQWGTVKKIYDAVIGDEEESF